MGGEDVGSEDEDYLAPLRGDPTNDASSDEETNNDRVVGQSKSRVQKQDTLETTTKESSSTAISSSKKRKRGDENSLRALGRGIVTSSVEVQSNLMTDFSGVKFLPQHIGRCEDGDRSEDDSGIAKRIQSIVSKKKLKKWKEKDSPCVVIVVLSARRAVQVLKELAPLSVRVAKLFAKHITIEEQVTQLQESPFPVAVGTPHRILALAKQGALTFEKTLCIALDTAVNDKKFSVYTLPDTVPHTQDLLREFIHPECLKRRDLRLSFV
jgi:U3-containing 90S pre-ribosomal complex subunit